MTLGDAKIYSEWITGGFWCRCYCGCYGWNNGCSWRWECGCHANACIRRSHQSFSYWCIYTRDKKHQQEKNQDLLHYIHYGVSQCRHGDTGWRCSQFADLPTNLQGPIFWTKFEYTNPVDDVYKTYLHNPPHYFVPKAMYIVTGAILYNQHLLIENNRKEFLLQTLLERAKLLGWSLQAWSVLNSHYHFIARAPRDAGTLEKLIRQLHSITAIEFNRRDITPGRQVWSNYWDSCLTYEKSYLARLHYAHMNPVKHKLTEKSN